MDSIYGNHVILVGLGRYIDRYGLGGYRIDTLGYHIAILSEILLATNLVISNLKIYIQVHSILSVNVRYLKKIKWTNRRTGESNDR